MNKSAADVFLDAIFEISTDLSQQSMTLPKPIGLDCGSFTFFLKKFDDVLQVYLNSEDTPVLITLSEQFLEQIKEVVDYSASNELCTDASDKEELLKVQQKMFSKEMLKRKKTLADLRKKVIKAGYNYRKGIAMETDDLSEKCLTNTLATENEKVSFLILDVI